MMLPFLTVLIAIWSLWKGRRRAVIGWWLATLLIYIAWCAYHMTGVLGLSF
ncbi:DUF5993 family protein [Microbulbifer sp. 2304DJ12-6]|uniref:DUF5993 family protein n=1 Tax=Microbulbifer sp. 2304DJ12-6 TaxID=3233340 RepID=UPI0039AFAD70